MTGSTVHGKCVKAQEACALCLDVKTIGCCEEYESQSFCKRCGTLENSLTCAASAAHSRKEPPRHDYAPTAAALLKIQPGTTMQTSIDSAEPLVLHDRLLH